jgi:hypothetical protein
MRHPVQTSYCSRLLTNEANILYQFPKKQCSALSSELRIRWLIVAHLPFFLSELFEFSYLDLPVRNVMASDLLFTLTLLHRRHPTSDQRCLKQLSSLEAQWKHGTGCGEYNVTIPTLPMQSSSTSDVSLFCSILDSTQVSVGEW